MIYCKDCKLFADLFMYKSCTYIIKVDLHHPIEPQETLGNYKVLNKNNDCPHYEERITDEV